MSKVKTPNHCRGCLHHNKGKPDSRHATWCCKFSNSTARVIGHCKMNNGKSIQVVAV